MYNKNAERFMYFKKACCCRFNETLAQYLLNRGAGWHGKCRLAVCYVRLWYKVLCAHAAVSL